MRIISKQKYSFHNGASEFVIPLNEPVDVPKYVEEHFLFRMALKAGIIIELAGAKTEATAAKAAEAAEAKTTASKTETKTEATAAKGK